MNVQDFVRDALVQVVEGVREAQDAVSKGTISPHIYAGDSGQYHALNGAMPQQVEFDIAVTATEEAGKSGGLSVGMSAFGLKGTIGDTQTESSESRIKFSVIVLFPTKSPK